MAEPTSLPAARGTALTHQPQPDRGLPGKTHTYIPVYAVAVVKLVLPSPRYHVTKQVEPAHLCQQFLSAVVGLSVTQYQELRLNGSCPP